jgi:cytochrome c peroxidase
MGGHGPSADDLLAIEAFVVSSRLPLVPAVDADLVAQGAELFAREDVGCASCHAGDRLTDGKHWRIVGDLEANTPGLRGIAATAPYLHDGSMKDLRSVLEWARGGGMGDTSMLSDQELDALEAYLRSL